MCWRKNHQSRSDPIPGFPRIVSEGVALVGAAGYVTKCSGEGIYFAQEWARWLQKLLTHDVQEIGDLIPCLLRQMGQKVLGNIQPDILQKVLPINPLGEAFEMCADNYVQKMTLIHIFTRLLVPGTR